MVFRVALCPVKYTANNLTKWIRGIEGLYLRDSPGQMGGAGTLLWGAYPLEIQHTLTHALLDSG